MHLTDIPHLLPPRVGHFLARVLGLGAAYDYFCPHCPEPDHWPADASDTPEAFTRCATETPGVSLSP